MNKENFVSKVFKWFGLGLLVTFLTAYAVSISETLLRLVFSGPTSMIIIILELVCAVWLSLRINKMSTTTAIFLYFGYTVLTGLTFSVIFLQYQLSSIIWIFLATSLIFTLFAYIGKSLHIDLRKFGIYLLIALLSIVVLTIVNIFLMNDTLDIVLCAISIVVFILYVAYDINKISNNMYGESENSAILGALNIYIDFINIFISLLRIFGKDRD